MVSLDVRTLDDISLFNSDNSINVHWPTPKPVFFFFLAELCFAAVSRLPSPYFVQFLAFFINYLVLLHPSMPLFWSLCRNWDFWSPALLRGGWALYWTFFWLEGNCSHFWFLFRIAQVSPCVYKIVILVSIYFERNCLWLFLRDNCLSPLHLVVNVTPKKLNLR